MALRDTKGLIKATALCLFNERGVGRVSGNTIAESCGISKGNMHYHFRTKSEIIRALFQDIIDEMALSWWEDESQPTVRHMAEMFERQLEMIWRHRFFYREMSSIVRSDPGLHQMVREHREARIDKVLQFFEALVEAGVVLKPRSRESLRYLVVMSWIFCDNWLNFIELQGQDEDAEVINTGYDMIVELLYPHLSRAARTEIYDSYQAISASFMSRCIDSGQ
jgi:AcrR family transcriptional regulator